MTTGVHQTNPLRMLLVLVLFMAVFAFLAIVIASGDPLWFVQGFSVKPDRVVVYQSGQAHSYQAGDEGFELLASAIQFSLDQGVARSSAIGLSAQSLQDAYREYLSVEAFFSEPVKLHAPFNTHRPTRMLFLITGRHSEYPLVFMGVGERYMSNGPVLKTNAPLLDALRDLGFETTPVD